MKTAVAATAALLPILASSSPLVHDSSFKIGSIHADAAPLLSSTDAKTIADNYIVVFKDHVDDSTAASHHDWVQSVHEECLQKRSQIPLVDEVSAFFAGMKHTYKIPGGLAGYAGHFDEEVIEQVRRHPDVAYVERDSIVHALDSSPAVENGAPWGLARISHRKKLNFGSFNKYLYSEDGGEGVDVYVIDTGTNVEHVDFEGRASWGKTIPANDIDKDGNGHGTHCSGTIAGKKYGVAKKAHVKAVKVLGTNGSGSMADVIKGVEFAALTHKKKVDDLKTAKGKKDKKFKGSAANMSLGGGASPALDKAVDAAVALGLHFAVAAGNDNADACKYSPAAAKNAITVGASTLLDQRAYFSNWGKCVDIFGPGLNVLSTWIGSKYATNTISGTSMASPHIAGLLAYFLSLQPRADSAYAVAEITPKQLKSNMISIATPGVLSDLPKDTVNLLAWNGGGSSNYTDIIAEGLAFNEAYNKEYAKSVVESTYETLEDDAKLFFEDVEGFFEEEVAELKKEFREMVQKHI